MARFEPAEFCRLLVRLNPKGLRLADGLVVAAGKDTEMVWRSTRVPMLVARRRPAPAMRVTRAPLRVGQEKAHIDGIAWVPRSVDMPHRHAAGPRSQTEIVVALARYLIKAPQLMSCRPKQRRPLLL